MDGLSCGEVLIEGKTKIIYPILDEPKNVLLLSKDKITAGDGARANDMQGKSVYANNTTSNIFKLLKNVGIPVAFDRKHSDTSFIARKCYMIPIEWVTRRIATGSFLKRNPGVIEGYKFCPPKLETFFKDDENHDPQWSREQLIAAKLSVGPFTVEERHISLIEKLTVTVFEVLEKAWSSLNCSLIDMKIEFGMDSETGEIFLADVIDNDSWRLWPSGDKRLQRDKQVYRELKEVTSAAIENIKKNYEWVMNETEKLISKPSGRVVIVMGSPSDKDHCSKIKSKCDELGLPCEVRVSSAHKATNTTIKILNDYEGEGIPTVFIAVAGRSNGLGPVLAGNACWPVINCPPIGADWGKEDVWSSLRLPSGLGCTTVIYPEAAALQAAQIFALADHMIWSRLRVRQYQAWVTLKEADEQLQKCS